MHQPLRPVPVSSLTHTLALIDMCCACRLTFSSTISILGWRGGGLWNVICAEPLRSRFTFTSFISSS